MTDGLNRTNPTLDDAAHNPGLPGAQGDRTDERVEAVLDGSPTSQTSPTPGDETTWPERAREILAEKHAESARQPGENSAAGKAAGAGTFNTGNDDVQEGRERWRELKS